MLRAGVRGGEEPRRVARGLQPLHVPLPLVGGLVGVLGTVIEIAVLAVCHSWEQFPFGGPVALQFSGDEHPRHVRQAFEQLAKELLRGLLVSPALHQDVEPMALLINGPPQVVTFALDGEKHLIEMPFVAGPRAAATQLIGIVLPELAAPFADGLLGHDHSVFEQ